MKISNAFDIGFQVPNSAGNPGSGATLAFYEAGTTPSAENEKDTYPTYQDAVDETNANANPVTLNTAGRPNTGNGIWLRGAYKVVCTFSDGSTWTVDYFNGDDLDDTAVRGVINGSFEAWSASEPDSITVTDYSGGSHEQDSADSYHGKSCIKVVSTGNGGADFISVDYFECSPGEELFLPFFLKASAADTRNIVELYWYDEDKVALAGADEKTTIYDEAAANPTNWTEKYGFATPPADARFYRWGGTLIDPTSSTLAATVRIDGVDIRPSVRRVNNLVADGDFTADSVSADQIADTAGTGAPVATFGMKIGDASNRDKKVTFHPSSGNAFGLRCVGWISNRSGSASYGGIVSNVTGPSSGQYTVTLARALSGGKIVLATAHLQGVSVDVTGGSGNTTLTVETRNVVTDTWVSSDFSVLVFEPEN